MTLQNSSSISTAAKMVSRRDRLQSRKARRALLQSVAAERSHMRRSLCTRVSLLDIVPEPTCSSTPMDDALTSARTQDFHSVPVCERIPILPATSAASMQLGFDEMGSSSTITCPCRNNGLPSYRQCKSLGVKGGKMSCNSISPNSRTVSYHREKAGKGRILQSRMNSRVATSWREMLLFLTLTILTVMTSHTTTAQQWEAEPVNTQVKENGRAVLRCQIRNLGAVKIAWLRANKNFFVDGDRWVAPARFNVSKVSVGDIGGYDLYLNGATRDDDADYTCQTQSQTLISTAHLTVLVPPRILTITKSQSDLTENDEVTFTCITSDGNPAPTIRWFRQVDQSEQWEELSGAVTTPPATKFNESRSELVRKMSRSDHKAHIKCTADNTAVTSSPPEHIITLDVKYAPVVRITPSDITGNKLVVVQGRNATLACHVDSNPYTSSRKWEKDGIPIAEVDYRAVAKEDSGNYTCVATNVIRSTRTWLTLDVQYGPVVKVSAQGLTADNKIYVAEGARINITCDVTSNPTVSAIQWKDAYNAVLGWDRNYVITNVRRTHAGSYSCFAESVLRPTLEAEVPVQGEEAVDVVVQYPPGKANVTGPRFVLVGQDAVLRCHLADKGVPQATLEWTQLGDPQSRVISREPELRFTPAQLSNNADYICKPTNSINDGEPGTFRLVVNEQPTWLPGGELPARMTVNVTTPGALMVQCQARGRPLPRVRWYQDDTPATDMDGLFTIETEHVAIDRYSFLVTSTLYWRGRSRDRLDRLKRSDTGRYKCQFTNEHGEIHSDMTLTVQYMPVLNVSTDKVATDMNQSAALSCSSHAVPMPRFTWYNRTTKLIPSSRVSMTTEIVNGEFPYRATLNISDVTSDDLGEYKCVGVNDLGFAEKYIFLTVKTTPDAPTNLQVLSRTWESVELTWMEGFDGGYRPTYFVFFTSARHNNTRIKVIPSNSKFNVTGLYPSTTYTFKVFGENQLGGGDYSANISTVTQAHPIEPPTEVFYHLVKRTLTFRSPSTNYCVRIECYDGTSWQDYAECAPPSGSVKIREGVPVSDVRIALCLQRRKEICSDNTKAFPVKPPPDDLSVETIIIVACVCGTVVLVLLCILIYLCIKRHQARRKDYENDLNAQRAAQANGDNKKITGIDNPSLDQTDTVDLEDRSRGRGFANDTSTRQNNANYVMFENQRKQQNTANGGPNQSNGYPSMNGGPNWNRAESNLSNLPHDPPPDYREVAKDGSTRESEYIAMHNKGRRSRPKSDVPDGHDSGYIPDHMKDGQESGLSTPDPAKPKKYSAFNNSGHQWQFNPSFSSGHPGYLPFPAHQDDIYKISLPDHDLVYNSRRYQNTGVGDFSGYPPPASFSATNPNDLMMLQNGLVYHPALCPQNPVLRIADDSPYGFHGAVPHRNQKKKHPIRLSHDDMYHHSHNNSSLKRFSTVSIRDSKSDLSRTDFIRGTLHDSMRLSSQSNSIDEIGRPSLQKQASFHYGFSDRKSPHSPKRLIPGPSYNMFQQFLQKMPTSPQKHGSQHHAEEQQQYQYQGQQDLGQQYPSKSMKHHDGQNYQHLAISQHNPSHEHSSQHHSDPLQSHDQHPSQPNTYNIQKYGNTPTPHVEPSSDSSYEMSMQVSKPGKFEVQLEVIHHRTSSGDPNVNHSSSRTGGLESNNHNNNQENHHHHQSARAREICAKRQELKPVKATKVNDKDKTSHDLPTDPRDAMAQILKEQGHDRDTDVDSDVEKKSVHNVKPSAVKRILHKKKQVKNVPKVNRRPQTLEEAMNKILPSQDISLGDIGGNDSSRDIKALSNSLPNRSGKYKTQVPKSKVKPNIFPKPNRESQHQHQNEQIGRSMSTGDVRAQFESNNVDPYSLNNSIASLGPNSGTLSRPCVSCQRTTPVNSMEDIEAVTDFTAPVAGETIFKTKKVLCDTCQVSYSNPTYQMSPLAQQEQQQSATNPVGNSNSSDGPVNWTSRTMKLQIPDPPYESDTDSNVDYSPNLDRNSRSRASSRGNLYNIRSVDDYDDNDEGNYYGKPDGNINGKSDIIYGRHVEGLYGIAPIPSVSSSTSTDENSAPRGDVKTLRSILKHKDRKKEKSVSSASMDTGTIGREIKPRDITKHFVPPPPDIPPPRTPNDIYGAGSHKSKSANDYNNYVNVQPLNKKLAPNYVNTPLIGSDFNKNVPAPPSTQPPTPPSVSLIPKQNNQRSNNGNPRSFTENHFTFPDLEVTLTSPPSQPITTHYSLSSALPSEDPAVYSISQKGTHYGTNAQSVYSISQCHQAGLGLLPAGVSDQYYSSRSQSSSSTSEQPHSEHLSTSVASHDDITSSSSGKSSANPVALIL